MPQFEELMEALDAKYFEADVTAAIEVFFWNYIFFSLFDGFFSGQKNFGLIFSKKIIILFFEKILGGKNGNRKANGTHGKVD